MKKVVYPYFICTLILSDNVPYMPVNFGIFVFCFDTSQMPMEMLFSNNNEKGKVQNLFS